MEKIGEGERDWLWVVAVWFGDLLVIAVGEEEEVEEEEEEEDENEEDAAAAARPLVAAVQLPLSGDEEVKEMAFGCWAAFTSPTMVPHLL